MYSKVRIFPVLVGIPTSSAGHFGKLAKKYQFSITKIYLHVRVGIRRYVLHYAFSLSSFS